MFKLENYRSSEDPGTLKDINIDEELEMKMIEPERLKNKVEKLRNQGNYMRIKEMSNELKISKNLSSFDVKNLLNMNLKSKKNDANICKNNSTELIRVNEFNSNPLNPKQSKREGDITDDFEDENDVDMIEIDKIVKKLDFEDIKYNDNQLFDKNYYKTYNHPKSNVESFFDFLFCPKKEY